MRYKVYLSVVASVVLAISGTVTAECFHIEHTNCQEAPANEASCENTACTPSIINPGFVYCPTGTTGCENDAEEYYDGYASGWGPFGGFNYGVQAVCVRCGDCKSCTAIGNKCKNDASNWQPQETYYHLDGVGVCN